jgi:uncharacterized protein (DUF1919 family)
MEKKEIYEHVGSENSWNYRCSLEDFIDELNYYLTEKGATHVIIEGVYDGGETEVHFDFQKRRLETDEEFEARKKRTEEKEARLYAELKKKFEGNNQEAQTENIAKASWRPPSKTGDDKSNS